MQRGRTVAAIAFDHGFNSPTHFGRVFRRKFGLTPREYRERHAQAAHAAAAPQMKERTGSLPSQAQLSR